VTDSDQRVRALEREGRHAEAAELCLEAGDHRRASDLLAAVWQYERAIDVAVKGELFDLAYAHALAGDLRDRAAALLTALADHPEQAVRAAEHAERRGRLVDAARLTETAGDVDGAAALYERAGELFDAARLRESEGRYRDAGLLYERRVRESPDDGEAALRLGRILAHFGRFEHAVRSLQAAADDPEHRGPALRLMVACFSALGLVEAAASRLDELRRADPSLPVTVPEFLSEQLGDERGFAALGDADAADRMLAGRYRVLRPLGSGATGRVLLAHDGFYDRDVAVKVLTVGAGGVGRDAYVRFAREARVAAGLDHPNVVRVFEFNADGPFLVMEYMAGGTLEDRLQGRPRGLSLAVTRHVVSSVLAGLEAVHRRGVVHRDLKPANVFFGAAGDVKIGDFGVAHLADLGATLTGALLGTLAYMAPEQITGSQRPDASTDLYALGVMLHRMLTGKLPFPGPDFVTQHLQDRPPPPSAISPARGRFDPLVAVLLAKDMRDRPGVTGDVRAMVDDLSWAEDDERAVEVATGIRDEERGATEERERPSTVPPPPAARYVPIGVLPDRDELARDEVLLRTVRVERCVAGRAGRLRAFAAADHPHLQAVYEVDEDEGRAILEHPTGRTLASIVDASARRRAITEIRAAVEHLHALGVVHGSISERSIVVGEARAVLLLPHGETPPDDAAADDAALASL
jgi:serine/threonine-protein kinase